MHLGDNYDEHFGAIVPPIFQNTLFTRKTKNHGYTYTRISNPTLELAEQKIAALEGGEQALLFSSGMGAITAALTHFAAQGSHIVAVKSIYAPARTFIESYLPKFGVESTFVDGCDIAAFEQAIRPQTKVIYLESPVSNLFTLQHLEQIADLAKAHQIITIVDNTWATPLYQNPIQFGIDVVVHSASKYLGGHSDIIGGVLISSASITSAIMEQERSMFGAVMDPHQAWLLTRGLRTLPVRMAQHQQSAAQVAAFLEQHPLVEQVLYPGSLSHPQYELGQKQMSGYTGVMSFIPKGITKPITEIGKAMSLFEIGPSWGGFESLLNFPGAYVTEQSYAANGIPAGLIRIAIGLEQANSIIDDLERGLHYLTKS